MKSDEKKVVFRVCGETRRCWRDVALVLGCVNLCLFVAGFVYLAVLHGEVAAFRKQLGRCSGSGAGTVSRNGYIHETKEDGTYTGKMHVTETGSRQWFHDRENGAKPTRPMGRRQEPNEPTRRHRHRPGIKALHMEGNLPLAANSIYPDQTLRHWAATEWTNDKFASFYRYNNNAGYIEVKESGLYFIYSQVTTVTNMLKTGHNISIDGVPRFVSVDQAVTTDSTENLVRTSSTSGVAVLYRLQKVAIGVSYMDVRVLMQPKFSYWGMIKLANVVE